MSKDTIPDFSATSTSNTDVGGVGITDADSAKNLRDAIQQLMRILKRTNDGTTPLDDVFAVRNVTDTTKTVHISAANVPTGTDRTLDGEALYRNGAWLETVYTASGTHTFQAKSRYFQIWAVGGGGGGGGADGQGAGLKGCGSGGSSGFFGNTAVLAKGAIATGTVVIGTGGAGGSGTYASGNDGHDGVATTWSDSTNSFTWGVGKGGKGALADTSFAGLADPPGRPTFSGGTLYGSADFDTLGYMKSQTSYSSAPPSATGGIGGSSPWGRGGVGGTLADGGDALGYGAGGGGAGVHEVTTNYSGGAGTPGILIVREW
jgi:hypothetical protein